MRIRKVVLTLAAGACADDTDRCSVRVQGFRHPQYSQARAMARLRSSWPIVALILGLLNNVCVRAEDDPCTLRDGDKFYDLRPLKAK